MSACDASESWSSSRVVATRCAATSAAVFGDANAISNGDSATEEVAEETAAAAMATSSRIVTSSSACKESETDVDPFDTPGEEDVADEGSGGFREVRLGLVSDADGTSVIRVDADGGTSACKEIGCEAAIGIEFVIGGSIDTSMCVSSA